MKKFLENMYLIKMNIIVLVIAYDCIIGSKYTIAWLGLLILYAVLHLDTQINKKE